MWTISYFVGFFVYIVVALGDQRCRDLGGTCQRDNIPCDGGYRSYLCNGASNRRCCLPSTSYTQDQRCNSQGGSCQYINTHCSGVYRSSLCGGPSNRKCCLPEGGYVDYGRYTVSDDIVREKLQAIASLFDERIRVTSGDRPNGRTTSHHYSGRAADFWVDGYTGAAIMRELRDSGILNRDFQVIWHGPGTRSCSSGQHIHIGRYGDDRSTCWVHEGTTSHNICKFHCIED